MKESEDAGSVLPDGYYWFRNFINLRGGGHVRGWKIAQVVGGRVRLVGLSTALDPACPYLRNAVWVRAEPPAADCGAAVAEAADRFRFVAGEIVDAFLGLSDATAAYYSRHPHHRAELVARIAGLIDRVCG